MSDGNDDEKWALVGKGLTISVIAVAAIAFLWFVLHLNIYDPAYNDGFEAGRKSMWVQCVQRNGGQCPSAPQLGYN